MFNKKKTVKENKKFVPQYVVHYGDCYDDLDNRSLTYSLWRVQIFDSYDKAVEFAKENSKYKPTYLSKVENVFKFSNEPKVEVL